MEGIQAQQRQKIMEELLSSQSSQSIFLPQTQQKPLSEIKPLQFSQISLPQAGTGAFLSAQPSLSSQSIVGQQTLTRTKPLIRQQQPIIKQPPLQLQAPKSPLETKTSISQPPIPPEDLTEMFRTLMQKPSIRKSKSPYLATQDPTRKSPHFVLLPHEDVLNILRVY